VAPPRADLVELRVLDGPNLYFPRPAVKLTIAVGGWLEVPRNAWPRRSNAWVLSVDPDGRVPTNADGRSRAWPLA
jgi:hypothetical protein